jgi:K+-transporting ATPase c subunit
MAAGLKFIMLVTQVYPLLSIMFGHSNLHTPLSKGSIVTTGDMMIIGSQIFISMYVFELFYRARVSYISTAHHIAAIVIAQSAVAIGLNYVHEKDATIEFVLVFVWGESGPVPSP